MADETTDSAADSAKKSYTPPKGRPTRARDGATGRRRAFGPVAQWITFVVALVVALVILILITDGGDFNPFDDDGPSGAPAAPAATNPA